MRLVAVTQRVDTVPGRDERRDALDGAWSRLLRECGCIAVPMPNDTQGALALWQAAGCNALLLSGGNDLASCGGDAPERDATELALLERAGAQGAPVLGVCRGMQLLATHSGARLQRVEGHVAVRHHLDTGREVNSYHGWAVHECPPGWSAIARSADGVLEMMRHRELPWLAIMWHPEREQPFRAQDIALIEECFHADRS